MKTSHFMISSSLMRSTIVLAVMLPLSAMFAQTTWQVGGVDTNWTTLSNWSTGVSPEGTPVIFGEAGKVDSTGTSSVVDGTYGITSLTLNNTGVSTGTNWQVLDLGGNTLTLGTGTTSASPVLLVGGFTATGTNTSTAIVGTGTLAINQTANVVIANSSGTETTKSTATLDLSGLSNFTADLTSGTGAGTAVFRVGSGRGSEGKLYLADTSSITAGSIVVGDTAVAGNPNASTGNIVSRLYLGNSTTLNATRVVIGAPISADPAGGDAQNNASGAIEFQSGGNVTIRGITGASDSRAIFTLGQNSLGNVGPANAYVISAVADFTGGSVDAMISTLSLATAREGTGTNVSITSSLSMSAGTIDATTVNIAQATGGANINAAAKADGTINVSGGSFVAGVMTMARNTNISNHNLFAALNVSGSGAVTVNGLLTLGSNTLGATAGTVQADINITGGSLTMAGNIAEAAGSAVTASTITLNGGTLNMGGNTITADTFNLSSGTLQNLNQFNSGGALTKGTGGVLIISGTNSYTGTTTVSLGTLLINGDNTAATGAISVINGATLGGAGTGVGSAITSAGTLSPGDGTTAIGTFNGTAVTLDTGANFKFELGAGNSSDRLALTGAFIKGTGSTFNFDFNNTGVASSTYTLATFGSLAGGFTAGDVSNFTYTGLAAGAASGTFGLTGTTLTFTTVPEPATWGLLAFSLTTVLVLRRRRNVRPAR